MIVILNKYPCFTKFFQDTIMFVLILAITLFFLGCRIMSGHFFYKIRLLRIHSPFFFLNKLMLFLKRKIQNQSKYILEPLTRCFKNKSQTLKIAQLLSVEKNHKTHRLSILKVSNSDFNYNHSQLMSSRNYDKSCTK